MPTETTEKTQIINPTIEAKPDFGTGRYAANAHELYKDSRRLLKLSHVQAERLGKAFMADYGKFSLTTKIEIGRISKTGTAPIKEIAKLKSVTITPALSLLKLCVEMDALRKLGIEVYTEVKLWDSLAEWIDNKD